MKQFITALILVLSCLTGCLQNDNQNNYQEETSIKINKHSKLLNITNFKSGYYIQILNPWKEMGLLGEYYLWPDSLPVPENLKGKNVIQTPIKSAVAFSSTQWAAFLKLGEIDKVKGLLESNYTNNQVIHKLIREGKIKDLGQETCIDTEKLISLKPDIILYSPYPTSNFDHLNELCGATVFPFADYLENHPLGRAEWLKVIGLLTGKENEAESWFDDIEQKYNELKSRCENVSHRPTVFSDLPFEGQWYVPGGESYIAQLFRDAGADYVWKDNASAASLPIDLETVLLKAKNADFWRIMNSANIPMSYNRLLQENEIYGQFKAFQTKKIIVCDVKNSGYFEQSQYQPDVILMDFINCFHPEFSSKSYQPVFYKLLMD